MLVDSLDTPILEKEAKELFDGLNDCSNFDYHADRKYLSSSVLKTVHKSLELYHREYILGLKEPTSPQSQNNFDVGSLTHSYILEPHLVKEDYNFYFGMRKAGAEFEAFLKGLTNKTLPIISVNQHKVATDCYEAFKRRKEAVELISGGFSEQTICGTLHGVPIKTRYDYINVEKGYIADVKTTGYSADVDTFKSTCETLMYPLSAALYCAMAEQYYGKKFDFYYIVLSKKDKTCEVFKTSKKTMNEGNAIVKATCEKFLTAKKSGNWIEKCLTNEQDCESINTSTASSYIIQEI